MNRRGGERDGWIWAFLSRARDKSRKRMRVAETLSLGSRRSLALVELDGEAFLVGCGHDQVNCVLQLAKSAAARPPMAGEEFTQ